MRRGVCLLRLSQRLIQEWSSKRNSLNPENVSEKSPLHAWWRCCQCSTEWNARICERANHQTDRGCPTCLKTNRLIDRYPKIAAEWSQRNSSRQQTPLPVDDISCTSTAKVYWDCMTCGCQWMATPEERVEGKSCPHCKDFFQQSLVENAVHQRGSVLGTWTNESVWQCIACGWEYRNSDERHSQGFFCPRCANQAASPLLSSAAPEVYSAIKAPAYIKERLRPTDSIVVAYQCPACGVLSRLSVRELCISGKGCPKCRVLGPSEFSAESVRQMKSEFRLNWPDR